jgi:hypothetical protein
VRLSPCKFVHVHGAQLGLIESAGIECSGFFANFMSNFPTSGVTAYEIDSKTEGCSYDTARCFEVSGLFIDVACFGKFWPPGRKYNRWRRYVRSASRGHLMPGIPYPSVGLRPVLTPVVKVPNVTVPEEYATVVPRAEDAVIRKSDRAAFKKAIGEL